MLSDGNLKITHLGLKFIMQGRSMDIADPQKHTDRKDLYVTWHTGQELRTKQQQSPPEKQVCKKTPSFLLVLKNTKTFLIYISIFLMENKDGF